MPTVNEITISGYIRAPETLHGKLAPVAQFKGEIKIPTVMDADYYTGTYEYTPNFTEQELQTRNKTMRENVVFHSIQTYETSNEAGGITFVI